MSFQHKFNKPFMLNLKISHNKIEFIILPVTFLY